MLGRHSRAHRTHNEIFEWLHGALHVNEGSVCASHILWIHLCVCECADWHRCFSCADNQRRWRQWCERNLAVVATVGMSAAAAGISSDKLSLLVSAMDCDWKCNQIAFVRQKCGRRSDRWTIERHKPEFIKLDAYRRCWYAIIQIYVYMKINVCSARQWRWLVRGTYRCMASIGYRGSSAQSTIYYSFGGIAT